jgi:hypothetical protein
LFITGGNKKVTCDAFNDRLFEEEIEERANERDGKT